MMIRAGHLGLPVQIQIRVREIIHRPGADSAIRLLYMYAS